MKVSLSKLLDDNLVKWVRQDINLEIDDGYLQPLWWNTLSAQARNVRDSIHDLQD